MPPAPRPRAILVVEAQPRRHAVLASKLRASGLEVWSAGGVDEAVALLKDQVPGAVLLATDEQADEAASACRALAQAAHGAPVLLLTADRSMEVRVAALSAGAVQVVPTPVSTREIVTHLELLLRRSETPMPQTRRGIARHAYVGRLDNLGLIDTLEQLQAGRLSGIVRLRGADARAGELYVSEGQVVDARAGALAGTEAVYRMMGWREGSLEVDGCPVRRPAVVSTPLPELILEGLRRREQWEVTLGEMPALETVLEVDYQMLADRLATIPDEVNALLRLCDSRRTIGAVIDDAPFPDLASARIIARLLADGVVIEAAPAEAALGVEGDLRARRIARWLGDEAPGAQPHAGSPILSLVEARSIDGRERTFYPDTHPDAPTPVGHEPAVESALAAAVLGGGGLGGDDTPGREVPASADSVVLLPRAERSGTNPGWPIATDPAPRVTAVPAVPAADPAVAPVAAVTPPEPPAAGPPEPEQPPDPDADRPRPTKGVIYVDDHRPRSASPPDARGVATTNRPIRDTELVRPLGASADLPDPHDRSRSRTDEWTAAAPRARRALVLAGLGAALGVGGALWLFLHAGTPAQTATGASAVAADVPRIRGDLAPIAIAPARSAARPTALPPAAVTTSPATVPRGSPPPATAPTGPGPSVATVSTRPGPAVVAGAAGAAVPVTPDVETAAAADDDLAVRCRRAYARQRYSGIVPLCAGALETAPDQPDLMAILAHAELDRGNYDRARKWARRALALDPRLADAHAYLGFIEDQAGRRDQAMAAYRAYLRLAPRGRYAEDIRAIVHSE
jgi:CheY-like chemotaxis protein